jgi:hypothetical protein
MFFSRSIPLPVQYAGAASEVSGCASPVGIDGLSDARLGSSHRGDCVDFHHQLGLRQTPHFHRRAGGHGVTEIFHSHIGMLEVLVDIRDVGIGSHEVAETCSRGFQRGFEVLERLSQLRAHVSCAHDPTILVSRKLPGDEDEPAWLDTHDVRVENPVVDTALMQPLGLNITSIDRQS